MRKALLIFIIATFVSGGCNSLKKSTANVTAPVTESKLSVSKFSEQSTWLLGYISPEWFRSEPHSEWFIKGHDDYIPNQEAMISLQNIVKDDLTIDIVLGTWCPDSRREVPRFFRIIELWGFPIDKVTLIGVDNTKIAPVGDFESFGIERVPTFILKRNNIEAGRIIENPETSLEQDIINILVRNEK